MDAEQRYKRLLEIDLKILCHVSMNEEEKEERKRIMDIIKADIPIKEFEYTCPECGSHKEPKHQKLYEFADADGRRGIWVDYDTCKDCGYTNE